MSRYGYLRSKSESPLDFEITRVDCVDSDDCKYYIDSFDSSYFSLSEEEWIYIKDRTL